MFLWFKKHEKQWFFSEFLTELQLILWDILFVYKNFIHWAFSKICISIWGIIIGTFVSFPFFISAVIVAMIDPIDWNSIIRYALSGGDISLEIIASLAQNPYWFIVVILLLWASVLGFFLGSSYALLLHAYLALHYIKRKKLPFKENLYFSRIHIKTMLSLLCWNVVYIIAPFFIGFSIVLGLYLLHQELELISYWVFSVLTMGVTIIFVVILAYVIYRILFWYSLLAAEKVSKIHAARRYIEKSIKITKGKVFFKFLLILGMFFIVMSPFNAIDNYLERKVIILRDTYVYKSWALGNISAQQREYYEFITQEYKDSSLEAIANKAQLTYIMQILYFFFSYFAFGGLLVVIIVSFYKRVLIKK